MTVSERAIHLGLLGAGVATCAWVFVRPGTRAAHDRPSPSLTAEGRAQVPTQLALGAALELTVDLKAVRQAPLGLVFAQRLGRVPSAERLKTSCGFDPLTRLDELSLAIPSAGLPDQDRPEEFGIVAAGRFSSAEIMACATSAIDQRGGEAVRSRLGHFDSVRDRNGGSGEVAARDGTLIVSGGAYFRELIDAAEGNLRASPEARARETRHAQLRQALGGDTHAARLTWLLAEGWFERVSGGERDARLSPLHALKALAARVDLDRTARISVLLECEDDASATRISSLASELKSSLSALPLDAALLGAATRVRIRRSQARLQLDLELSQAELGTLLDLLVGP